MADGPWYWCMKHNTVEPKDGCAERHRLGPYDTREQQLNDEDKAWEGD